MSIGKTSSLNQKNIDRLLNQFHYVGEIDMPSLVNTKAVKELHPHQFFVSVQKQEFPKDLNCYVLGRGMPSGSFEVILCKALRDEQEFDNEVESIKKIFDAVLL